MPARSSTEITSSTQTSISKEPELVLYMDEEDSDEEIDDEVIFSDSTPRIRFTSKPAEANSTERSPPTINITQESVAVNLEILGKFLRSSYNDTKPRVTTHRKNSSQDEFIKVYSGS
ncbi:hypothetical protein K7432_003299 [Basidiobolus ranarum]|uniref:Uncharacterized protein n=1 Tax=Basidiobolus ranarum TaxID=34480 RepID=A0ABR2X084_9FUNG